MNNIIKIDKNTNLHPDCFEIKHYETSLQHTNESVTSREIFLSKDAKKYEEKPLYNTVKNDYAKTALHGIQEVSIFSNLYFSKQNIKEIQKLIRFYIYKNTNKKYIIDNQNEAELIIIMRSIYLQYGRVPKYLNEYTKEIQKLNNLVINYILPRLISDIEQYMGYLRDISEPYKPIEHSIYTSIKGEKELRTVTDVLIGDDNFFK